MTRENLHTIGISSTTYVPTCQRSLWMPPNRKKFLLRGISSTMSFLENKEKLSCKVKLYLDLKNCWWQIYCLNASYFFFKLKRKLGSHYGSDLGPLLVVLGQIKIFLLLNLIYEFTVSLLKIIVFLFLLQVWLFLI